MSGAFEELTSRIGRLERQLARERASRLEAERLLECKSLELYRTNQRLVALNTDLELRVKVRTEDVERERRAAIEQAERDLLTGLANRGRFQAHLGASIEHCAATGTQAALLLVDLDRFKQVNDRLGHAAGDALLIQATARLREAARATDLVARLGGDEFAIILSAQRDGLAAGVAMARRICEALARPFDIDGLPISSSGSIGISAIPAHTSVTMDAMRYADLALYAAKAQGRGRFAAFHPAMLADFEERHQLEHDLREAITSDGITVHLQPIVDTRSGQVRAAEVLARWCHPTRGMIPPDRFIAIAEERGLIQELGRKVLRAACDQSLPFLRGGALKRISVNISPLQLQDRDIVDHVLGTLREFGLAPDQLLLEVTESVMLSDHPAVRQSLETLRKHGISLALDDFGAGYSNLSYLTQLRVDVLKLDRSFVAELGKEPAAAAMIRSITALAHELGVKVVIEGVETAAQHALILSYGCDFAQGYHYSKPLPAPAFQTWLTHPNPRCPPARTLPAPTSPQRQLA